MGYFVCCSTSTRFIFVQFIKYVTCIIDCVFMSVNGICTCMYVNNHVELTWWGIML